MYVCMYVGGWGAYAPVAAQPGNRFVSFVRARARTHARSTDGFCSLDLFVLLLLPSVLVWLGLAWLGLAWLGLAWFLVFVLALRFFIFSFKK